MIQFAENDSLDPDRVILSGSRRAGKSYVAKESGYDLYGVADPMYKLSEHYLGTSDKSTGGVRGFLQAVGALGRGESPNAECPLARHSWSDIKDDIQTFGHEITGMLPESVWDRFGETAGFWVKALCARVEDAGGRIAVPNGRFPNEINRLTSSHGFEHRHVMCHPDTRRTRLRENGEDADLESEDDVTEQLAQELNQVARNGHKAYYSQPGDLMYQELDPGLVLAVTTRDSVIWSDPNLEPDFTTLTSYA